MATFDNITLEIIEHSADNTGFTATDRIQYNGFDKEVKQSDIEMILSLFLTQEKSSLTPIEFINKVRGSKKDDKKEEKKEPDPDKKPKPEPDTGKDSPEPGKDSEEEKDKKKRRKKKDDKDKDDKKEGKGRIVVKTVATLGALAIIAVGGWHVYKHIIPKSTLDNNDGPDLTPTPRIEQQVTEEPKEPIIDAEIPGDELLPYVNRGSSDWIAMSDDEYLNALNAQTIACQMNMPEISIFLENGVLEGEKHVSHIENSFRKQSPDFCIVEYFNQCRNDVVNAAYDTKNRDNVKIMQDIHMRELYLFITNQTGVTLNTSEGQKTFYWNTISDEARNAILDVFFGLTISLDHSYVLSIDGATFTPEQLGQLYEAELARLTLINPTFRK